MAIDFEKLGFTKRSGVLLGILVVLFATYYFMGTTTPPPTMVSVGTPVGAGVNGTGSSQAKNGQMAPVAPPTGAATSSRDPFLVPAAYRHPEAGTVTETASARPPTAGAFGSGGAAGAVTMPQLKGTMVSSSGGAAIVAIGDDSRSLKVGQGIDGYTLIEVGKNYAVVAGPGGAMTLRMGR